MPAFKQKLARMAAGSGILACATAAFLVVGGVGASSALATCSTTIEGQGSSLQKVAQTEVFAPAWKKSGCGTGSNAEVNYVATSSGKGLEQWGYTGSGTVNNKIAIIGTDDGPSEKQIESAKSAGHGANTVIVPVTQTAIAIMIHPPSGCTLPENKLTNARLDEAFSGKAKTWAEIGGSGTCTGAIKRVVRFEGSGTTYQFKNYLAKIHGWTEANGAKNETAICSGTTTKWSELEPLTTPNTTWPTSCGSTTPLITAEGGGKLAETVVATEGAIGYASLPDAKAKGATSALIQDGVSGTKPTYAAPNTGEEANCGNAKYTVPTAGRKSAGTSGGVDVDWSQVFGGNPTIGTGYSICTLTYDLGWRSYATAFATAGTPVGEQVKKYYQFILSNKLGSTPKYYSNLPTGGGVEANNVQEAAEFAAGKIS